MLCVVHAISPNSGQSGLDEASAFPKPALLGHLFVDKQFWMAYATEEGIEDLAQDVPASERRVLLATQGPIAFAAFQGKMSHAAWETKPSWSMSPMMIEPSRQRRRQAPLLASKPRHSI
jgi:hypothetical protein